MSENIYSWEFDDTKKRWSMWYIITLSIVIWISIWWFFTKQYWMSFIVLLVSWLLYFIENNSINNILVNINNLWINIAWRFYNYESIDSFLIIYDSEIPILLRLNLNKKWIRIVDLKINKETMDKLNIILPEYIEQKSKQQISFSEKIIHFLKL